MKKQVLFGIALLCSAFLSSAWAATPLQDTTYNAMGPNGEYTLTNKWLYSVTLGNYVAAADKIGTSGFVRGMAVKDGKMLFIDREKKQITVVNGETGLTEAPIVLASNIFTYMGRNKADTADSIWVAGFLPFNDIKSDNAGNVLLGNCIISSAGRFQVWKVNLTDGSGTLIIDQANLATLFPASTIRFDAFGVWGDVNTNAIIMASNALAMEAYKWTITNGVASDPVMIEIDNVTAGTYLTGLANPGSAPQIFPVEENYFYLDGNATYPTLIDMDGNVIDGFYNNPDALKDSTTMQDKILTMNQGHNGLAEFQVGEEYFVVMAATNTAGTPPSSFRLFKFADANKAFTGLDCLWTFPMKGMGGSSNAYRTAMPAVEVNGNTAKIYVYTGENGYGMYEFKVTQSGKPEISLQPVTVSVKGNTLKLSETVANLSIYNVTGQLIGKFANVSSVESPGKGVFVVKATTLHGETAIQKVIVK
ncbi:T9SS type A sorting domain-containing protein [Porphyromonadaceae sp. NP-X]|jgi:hypothetical protein|nr:T9SS type A sorting domain-containing protein [Porphyromonadaceae sp. NP-X]